MLNFQVENGKSTFGHLKGVKLRDLVIDVESLQTSLLQNSKEDKATHPSLFISLQLKDSGHEFVIMKAIFVFSARDSSDRRYYTIFENIGNVIKL